MPKCGNCVHWEICNPIVSASEDSCTFYKDSSRFVELPCKVGDAVYKICPVEEGEECNNCPWEYCECYDIGFIKDRHNSIRKGMIHNLVWLIKRMPYFGKIYFTNYENAEKALKERENNAN